MSNPESPEEVKNAFTSSLADLTFNSKPLINMLTMLAEENLPNAKVIVEAIETHLSKVATDIKLPVLYLIDCIVKNVGKAYSVLFSQNIVSIFCSVFKVVDEKTRGEMFKLRQTWNDVFPQHKLYAIDVQINFLDPAWPVTAQPANSIHFNPKFLKTTTTTPNVTLTAATESQIIAAPGPGNIDKETLIMQEKLIQKQKELLELQQKKLELEVLQTQVKLQEQMKTTPAPNILLKPEVAKQLIPTAMSSTKSKPTGIASSVMNQRLQNNLNSQSRINPVNSALASAVKPTRDPRLLRQQPQPHQGRLANNQLNTLSGQVVQKTTVLENNKNVTNKLGLRESHKDPPITNKNNTVKSKTFLKSRSQLNVDKSSKRASHARSVNKTNVGSESSSVFKTGASGNSSNSSLDSPTKLKSEKSLKLTKIKRKEKIDGLKNFKDAKNDKPVKNDNPVSFKNSKLFVKNRNYVRRNMSASPEPLQDEDLRAFGPPEKQARLQCDSPDDTVSESNVPNKGMDVDLRQFPAVVSKKRSSTESAEQNSAKKTKMFDVLFGHEDTDLRQLAVTSDRPPTPPPPIISSSETVKEKPNVESPKKTNLDAVRAKLANAANWDKVKEKSFHKSRLLKSSVDQDQDLRSSDGRKSIIISPDDEKSIKSGAMTREQQTQLLSKIFIQIEQDKLREAKKKDHENSVGSISLQPISDDEFEDLEDKTPSGLRKDQGDRHTSHLQVQGDDQAESQYYQRDTRRYPGTLRGTAPRRGRGGRLGRENQLMVPTHRANIRPWLQAPKWRNYPQQESDFIPSPPHPPEITYQEEDGDRSGEQLTNGAVNQDQIKTMNIDGIPRDIRYYGETAVVFLNWDDPRDLAFQDGVRRVIFNDTDVYLLSFGDTYKDCIINGVSHKVKLGSPSRELYIDEVPYECYFGGAGILVDLNGEKVSIKLEGPLPHVKIGETKRTDLVAGKINLIINAKIIVPVFLDAQVQKFVIDGETSTLKFVDALQTVLINDIPFSVEFGGLPKPFTIHDKKHFIRFSVLPKGIKPGLVRIKDMDSQNGLSPKYAEIPEDSSSSSPAMDANETTLSAVGKIGGPRGAESPNGRSNSPSFFQNLLQPNLNNFDMLSNALSSSMVPMVPSTGGYQVDNPPLDTEVTEKEAHPLPVPIPPTLNINDLFQKLVASGFVKTELNKTTTLPTEVKKSNIFDIQKEIKDTKKTEREPPQPASAKPVRRCLQECMKPVTFSRPETLKVRQSALYMTLYSGMQCSSCGMRFPPEASMQYSQHLDWHFRQNRKGKRNSRVATSRKWYYSLTDWKNYEEIEDLEEREKNYFDQQQQQAEVAAEETEEDYQLCSVPADPDRTDEACEVCRDKFEQFFNEEKEEWHLRNAMKVDEKTYHPLCYKDYQKSLTEQNMDESKADTTIEEEKQGEAIPGLEIVLDDDEEEAPHSPSDIPEVVSLDDDEPECKPTTEETPEEQEFQQEEDDDDDVILNEVAPVKIVVDDDDDDEDQQHADISKVDAHPFLRIKKERHVIEDDGFVDVGEGLVSLTSVGQIKIKSEPIDPDELPVLTSMDTMESNESLIIPEVEEQKDETTEELISTHHELITSIDGNIELVSSAPVPVTTVGVSSKIKINISKPLPVISPKDKECSESIEPSPITDSPELSAFLEEPDISHLKPELENVELKRMPRVKKGTELTGLCSIM